MSITFIDALPTPPVRGTDTGTPFSTKVDALLTALPTFVTQANAFGTSVVDTADGANYSTTSVTSVAIGTGSKSFTTGVGKRFLAGEFVTIASAAAPTTNYMYAQISSYNSSTGAMVVTSLRVGGSGTYADWLISLSGPQGTGGDTLPSMSGNAYKFLQLNSGETAAQWAVPGWNLIATGSPSTAANYTFTSIPTYYKDLLVRGSTTNSGAVQLTVSISPDGASFSTARNVGPSSGTVLKYGILLPDYRADGGTIVAGGTSTASPTIYDSSPANPLSAWACTGGIQAIRLAPASGTFTGSISLYGRY